MSVSLSLPVASALAQTVPVPVDPAVAVQAVASLQTPSLRTQDKPTRDARGQVPDADLNKALSAVNSGMEELDRTLKFEVNRDASPDQVVIDVIDTRTGKVVKKIPSETVIKVAAIIAKWLQQQKAASGVATSSADGSVSSPAAGTL